MSSTGRFVANPYVCVGGVRQSAVPEVFSRAQWAIPPRQEKENCQDAPPRST